MDLSIILLNYNGKKWLELLLPSLKAHFLDITSKEVEVVVVDNASTDDSIAYLETIDFVRVLPSPINGGFAYGNNLALKNITTRYALLLNSDTQLLPNVSNFDELIDLMDAHPVIGICTPKILLDNHEMDPACHRGEPTPWAAFCYFSGLEKMFGKSKSFGRYHLSNLPLDTIHKIEACSGAAMMVRCSAFEKVGLLDERFFMYAEDIDWCKRFRESDYTIVYNPSVQLLHHKYKSGIENNSTITRSKANKHFYTTMLQYYDKHYAARYPSPIRWLLYLFVKIKN